MTLIPINYKLSLEPDLEKFSFNGFLKLILEAGEKIESVCLNILELDIHYCQIDIDDKLQDCAFEVDTDSESLTIKLPEPVSDKFCLLIKYTGIINDKMAGFYRSQYISGDTVYPIAVTQFQESDARRAFPCFDHPGKKAVFDIELIIDEHLTAISNQDTASVTLISNDKKGVSFKQSPKMSTYLVFWCVGNFQFIENSQDRRVRLAYLPGMEAYVDFGLDFGQKALAFCEQYYGISYPLSKLDLIAIPDFAFGAMENWGAITFRENLLLFYPEITSASGAERIAEVIAHEIAHQWFGNLVTPADWKFLWLNESFATYFGFGVVDHYYPEWETWPQFLYSQTLSALERDAYPSTIPIEIPGGDHVVINTSTAPIIYCKGGSILRQIKGYIGDDDFKKGVRLYLENFAYGCAASRNLWESFEHASNKPVIEMMKTWIEQAGYPILEAKRTGSLLTLTQKRFSFQPDASGQQIWQIPVSISIRKSDGLWQRIDLLMDGPTATLDLGGNDFVYKINSGQTGFYRVNYGDIQNLQNLGNDIRDKKLPPEDRWGLENDLFARVRSGEETPETYLSYLSFYDHETNFLPLRSIADHLFHLFLFAGKINQDRIKRIFLELIENVFHQIGFEPDLDEGHTVGSLRDQFIWLGVFFNAPHVSAFARTEFQKMCNQDPVHPDIMKSIFQAAAFTGDEDTYSWMIQRLEKTASEHERTNILVALGCFQDSKLIPEIMTYTLHKVPPRNQSIPIASLALNPSAANILWDWYTLEKEVFLKFHPLIHERVFAAIVPASVHTSPQALQEFLTENKIKINPDVVAFTIERLKINKQLANRLKRQLYRPSCENCRAI